MQSRHDIISKMKTHGSKADAFVRSMCGISEYEVSASGAWIYGDQGGRYLDFGSFAIFLLGHAPPAYLANLNAQLTELAGSSRAMLNARHAEALEAFCTLTPAPLSKVMLLNSGADAVEAAIKLATVKTKRNVFLHLEHSFHGKTCGALALTDAAVFRQPFQPLLMHSQAISRSDAKAASDAIIAVQPAAVFCEPIQGEGGIYELAIPYLQALRQACDRAGALLVVDEIQSGLGRSGDLWAHAASGIVPDILLSGKALGGGIVPVSALAATAEAFAPFDANPFLHTSTFAANPLACRALTTTVACIAALEVPARARYWGGKITNCLRELQEGYPGLFGAITGRGLLQGLHCTSAAVASQFLYECLQGRLLLTPCLSQPTVLRLSPPAVLEDDDVLFARKALFAAAAKTQTHLSQGGR